MTTIMIMIAIATVTTITTATKHGRVPATDCTGRPPSAVQSGDARFAKYGPSPDKHFLEFLRLPCALCGY